MDDNKLKKVKCLLSNNYSWLDTNTEVSFEELSRNTDKYLLLKKKLDELIPFVYSELGCEQPEYYNSEKLVNSFGELNDELIDYKKFLDNFVEEQLSNNKVAKKDSIKTLEKVIKICENTNNDKVYLARRLYDKEKSLKDDATENADDDYLILKNRFFDEKWKVKDIGSLEEMLESSDLLVEKARFLNDSELVYQGSVLSNEIVGVVKNLKRRRSMNRKTKLGLLLGAILTITTLVQPYLPIEPVQNVAKRFYSTIKENVGLTVESNKSN